MVRQDFTEVDNNVTRHVPWELDQDDWDGMILHYLGLDHIGHKSGPKRYIVHAQPSVIQSLILMQSLYDPKTIRNGFYC